MSQSIRTLLTCLAYTAIALGFQPHAHANETTDSEQYHVVMYKDPTCGCCEKWADHLRAHGFSVESRPTDDMLSIKMERGVPRGGSSCHTAEVAGYVIEGHVPAGDIKRLLWEKPDDVRLLTVPAMPLGSPGMEHPNPQSFATYAVRTDDTVDVFAEHEAGEDFSPAAEE